MSMLSEYFIINFCFCDFLLISLGNINEEKDTENDQEKVEGKSKANDKPESCI